MFFAVLLGFAFLMGMVAVNFINHRFTEPVPRYMWILGGLWMLFAFAYIILIDKS